MGGVTKGAWIFWIFCAVAVFNPGGSSDLSTSADATSNSGTEVCNWTRHVKGRVEIKDKATLIQLAIIDEGKVCPDGVSFNSCKACVNETSYIHISCQISGNDHPQFFIEYDGMGMKGETGVADFQGCAKPETAIPETAIPETAIPETAIPETAKPEMAKPEKLEEEKPGRNRWGAILASVLFVCLFIIWLWIRHSNHFSLWKQCRDWLYCGRKMDQSQSTNGHTNGTPNGKKQTNGMAETVV